MLVSAVSTCLKVLVDRAKELIHGLLDKEVPVIRMESSKMSNLSSASLQLVNLNLLAQMFSVR